MWQRDAVRDGAHALADGVRGVFGDLPLVLGAERAGCRFDVGF